MRPRSTILALAVLLALVPATGAETATYVAPGGDLALDARVHCPPEPAADACVGGAVFDVPAESSRVEVTVDDAVVPEPASLAIFRGPEGAYLADRAFCGSTPAPVPPDAATLTVHVLTAGPPLGIWGTDCPLSPGTAGTIQATWS